LAAAPSAPSPPSHPGGLSPPPALLTFAPVWGKDSP
jgi:hypothetical protein